VKYIIGIGNYSMGDDSVGLQIVEYIDEHLPEREFEVIDMSDNGLNLVAYLNEETERILFVDCVKMGKAPGETLVFSPDEVRTDKALANISTHEGDMIKIIQMLQGLGYVLPPMRFFGIEPESCEAGLGELSGTLQARLPEYVHAVTTLLDADW